MKKILLICLLLLPCRLLKAQINLVPNPSFEIIDTSCIRGGGINFWYSSHMVGWWPIRNTADYFTEINNICTDWPNQMNQCAQPSNILTYNLAPASGNTYAGVFTFEILGGNGNYREQIQCKLISPMIVNHYYQVKFKTAFCSPRNRLRAGAIPPKASTNLGIKFTNQRFKNNIYSSIDTIAPLNLSPDIKPSKQISDTNWVEVSGIFKADSAFNYLILGGFGIDATIDTVTIPNGVVYDSMRLVRKEGSGYYFFDDLSVMEIDTVFQNTSSPLASSFNASLLKDVVQIKGKGEVYHIAIYDQLGGLKFELSTKDPITEINLKNYTFPGDVVLIKVNSSTKIQTFKYINYE